MSDLEERRSGALLISIENYDPQGFQTITSPCSLKAMEMLGIGPAKIRIKSLQEVRALIRDADPVQSEYSIRLYMKKAHDQYEQFSAKIRKLRDLLKHGARQRKLLIAREHEIEEQLLKHNVVEAERVRRIEERSPPEIPIVYHPKDRVWSSNRKSTESLGRPRSNSNTSRVSSASLRRSQFAGGSIPNDPKLVAAAVREEAVKQIEDIIDFELHVDKLKKNRMHLLHDRIRERRVDMEERLKKYMHVVSDNELDAMFFIHQKKVEKEIRDFEEDVHQRAHDAEQKVKMESVIAEVSRLKLLHDERESCRRKRENIKHDILKEAARLRSDNWSNNIKLKAQDEYLKADQRLERLVGHKQLRLSAGNP